MAERHQCVDCSRQSPPTETGYTLISREFGWRLTRTRAGDGSFVLEWRCPSCWQKYKATQSTRPWEPPRRPPPRISEQDGDDARPLSQSGEYSRAIYEEEFPPPSSRRRAPPGDTKEEPVLPTPPDRGLPRKG